METRTSKKGEKIPASQFKATALWEQIISHFKSNVKRRQRHYFLRPVADCFSGADATNTVLVYLLSDHVHFNSADISRVKAAKVCQLMLDDGVFQSVGGPHKHQQAGQLPALSALTPMKAPSEGRGKKPLFRDSANKLYHFSKDPHSPAYKPSQDNRLGAEECVGLENGGFSERSLDESLMQELLDMTTVQSSEVTPPQCTSMTSQQSSQTPQRPGAKTFQAFQHCQREVLIRYLLQTLDISHLDDLLQEDSAHVPTYDNLIFFDPSDSLEDAGIQSTYLSDPLVELAAAVLDFLPKGRDSFHRACSRSLRDCKLLLHRRIEAYYTNLSACSGGVCRGGRGEESLLPVSHSAAYTGVASLLEGREVGRARRALNASLLLLPPYRLSEVEALLRYLDAFGHTDLQLQTPSLLDCFVKAFIHPSVMPHHRAKLVVTLMVGNCNDICTMSPEIQSAVDGVITGNCLDKSYCRRVSSEEFDRESTTYTESQIVALINCIADHTSISLKDKAAKLKLLKKANPALFAKHFPQLTDFRV